jgi:hypothetical protein
MESHYLIYYINLTDNNALARGAGYGGAFWGCIGFHTYSYDWRLS